jgi:hypothetical protein
MQELFEYYLIGVIFTMGVGEPSGKGPAGQGVGSVHSSGHGSASGTTDTLDTSSRGSGTYSFGNLDDLLSKLNKQIQQGTSISEEDALNNLKKIANKLDKWDTITFEDIERRGAHMGAFYHKLSSDQQSKVTELVHKITTNRIDPGKIHVSVEEYANIQKKLVTSNLAFHHQVFSVFEDLVPRLETPEMKEKLSNSIKNLKGSVDFKLNKKLEMLEEMKENSKILREVYKKK